MNDGALERIMNSPDLPTLPAVAAQMLELTTRSDVELSEIAKVIEHDPAIATRVLKTVNNNPSSTPLGRLRPPPHPRSPVPTHPPVQNP